MKIQIPTNKRKHSLFDQDFRVFTFIQTHLDKDGNFGESDSFIANAILDGNADRAYRSRHRLIKDGWLRIERPSVHDPKIGNTPTVVRPTASLSQFIKADWIKRRDKRQEVEENSMRNPLTHETVHAEGSKPVSCGRVQTNLNPTESANKTEHGNASCGREVTLPHAEKDILDSSMVHETVCIGVIDNRLCISTPVRNPLTHETAPAPIESPLDKARRNLAECIEADRKSSAAGYPNSWDYPIQKAQREVERLEVEGW